MPGNAYDVYTLPKALKQAVVLWGMDPAIVFIHALFKLSGYALQ
jgi:hypothetical protein